MKSEQYRHDPFGDRLRRGEWCVSPISLAAARELVERYHYLMNEQEITL